MRWSATPTARSACSSPPTSLVLAVLVAGARLVDRPAIGRAASNSAQRAVLSLTDQQSTRI